MILELFSFNRYTLQLCRLNRPSLGEVSEKVAERARTLATLGTGEPRLLYGVGGTARGTGVSDWPGEAALSGRSRVLGAHHPQPHYLAGRLLPGRGGQLCLLQSSVGVCQQPVEHSRPGPQNGQSVVDALWRAVEKGGRGLLRFDC